MPGYLDLARQALARSAESAHPARPRPLPLPSRDREQSEVSEITPAAWDQAEAERLLDHLRRELARLERTWPGGQVSPGQGERRRHLHRGLRRLHPGPRS